MVALDFINAICKNYIRWVKNGKDEMNLIQFMYLHTKLCVHETFCSSERVVCLQAWSLNTFAFTLVWCPLAYVAFRSLFCLVLFFHQSPPASFLHDRLPWGYFRPGVGKCVLRFIFQSNMRAAESSSSVWNQPLVPLFEIKTQKHLSSNGSSRLNLNLSCISSFFSSTQWWAVNFYLPSESFVPWARWLQGHITCTCVNIVVIKSCSSSFRCG